MNDVLNIDDIKNNDNKVIINGFVFVLINEDPEQYDIYIEHKMDKRIAHLQYNHGLKLMVPGNESETNSSLQAEPIVLLSVLNDIPGEVLTGCRTILSSDIRGYWLIRSAETLENLFKILNYYKYD